MGCQSTTRPMTLGLPRSGTHAFRFHVGSCRIIWMTCYMCYVGATSAITNLGFLQSLARSSVGGGAFNTRQNTPMVFTRWKRNRGRLIRVKCKAQVCIHGLRGWRANLIWSLRKGDDFPKVGFSDLRMSLGVGSETIRERAAGRAPTRRAT